MPWRRPGITLLRMRIRRISGLVLAFLAGTAFVACDSSDSEASSQGEVTTTTTTAPARVPGFDYARPGGAQTVESAGSLEGVTPDGSFIVSAPNKRYTEDTCESVPLPILHLLSGADPANRRPMLNGTKPLRGIVLRSSTGNVAVIGMCEEHQSPSFVVADQAPDGSLSNGRTVEPKDVPGTGYTSVREWAWDGSSLVGSTGSENDTIGWTFDPSTGRVTERARARSYGFGLLADGLFVVDDADQGDSVFIRDANGQRGPTGGGGIFQVAPDGRRVATFGLDTRDLGILTPTGYDIVAQSPPGTVIGDVVWAPDGRALAFMTLPEESGAERLRTVHVVDLATRRVTEVAGKAVGYDALQFSPSGEMLAWNSWSGDADGESDIMWIRFPRT